MQMSSNTAIENGAEASPEATLLLRDVVLRYVNLYRARTFEESPLRPRYSVAMFVDHAETLKLLAEAGAEPRKGRYNASSIRAPLISVADGCYDGLIKAHQLSVARNLCLDTLLEGKRADVLVRAFSYEHSNGVFGKIRGRALGLYEVIIDCEDLPIRVAGFTHVLKGAV